MNTSFYTGIGGVKAQQFGLDTWGNNISNINTVGYRSSTPEFATLFAVHAAGIAMGGADEVGLGVTSQTTALSMKQGSLQNTDRPLDLAIEGKGWFGVKKANDPTQTYFTRAGDFYTDALGNVTNGQGDKLVGTYSGNMTVNKDGTASVGAKSTASAKLLTDAKAQVELKLPTYVTHPGIPGTPAVMATIPDFTVASLGGGSPTNITYTLPKQTTARLEILDSTGAVIRTLPQSTQVQGDHTVAWNNKDENGAPVAAGNYTVRINYVDKVAIPAIGVGSLKGYEVDSNGMVVAAFDNGQSQVVAQIPLFHFQNEQGLEKVGDSEFRATDNSGEAFFYKDATGNVVQGGKIANQTLEMSNVSTAEAMTQLIITEKAYSANAKVVSTADQMIQKAINLKRG